MQRTISIKIEAPQNFTEYLKICSEIFNKYVSWSFDNKLYNKNKAHKELYEKFRKNYPTIPSAILQSIRDSALESVKALKFKFRPNKKPLSSIRYDKRTISLRKALLSIAWSGERIKQKIQFPKFFLERYSDWKFQAATIGWDFKNQCIKANLIFESQTPEKLINNKIAGIDCGLYNIVTLSDGYKFGSNHIRAMKRRMFYLKRKLQAKGTPSAKRKLKKLSGYEKRFSLNQNHIISKMLVNLSYDIFVLEDLTGIRKIKSKGKKLNNWLSSWSFFQLESLLKYKAEILGKTVVKVDPRYTSQKCSNCGLIEKSNRNKSKYHCSRCGFHCHADVNAAINIKNNYIISTTTLSSVEQAICQLTEC